MQDRLEGMDLRLYDVRRQMAKLHDKLTALTPHDTVANSFGRRGSRASVFDIASAPSQLTAGNLAMHQGASPVPASQAMVTVGWEHGRPGRPVVF